MNLDGIHAAVGDDEILQFRSIINAVEATSRLILDNRVAHAQSALCGFQHRLAVDADETVADDGVVDDVVGAFAAIHEHDLIPLAGLVGITGFQTVALDDDGSLGSAFNDELSVAPCENATATVNVNVEVTEQMGSETYLYLTTTGKDGNIIARVDPRTASAAGMEIKVAFELDRLHFFDKDTERTICN